MATEKIIVKVNNEVIELTGSEKEAFESERQEKHEAFLARQNAEIQKQAARESALAKLAALGLTEEEIAAL